MLTRAQNEAERSGQSYIGTEHLLLGLIGQEDGLAYRALTGFGIPLNGLRASIERILVSEKPNPLSQIIPTSRVKRIIEIAFDLGRGEGSSLVDTGHLLLAIVQEGHGIAAQVLAEQGVTVDRMRSALADLRQAGQAEKGRQHGAIPLKYPHRHLDIKDKDGRSIVIDIRFPAEYSEVQSDALTARVEKAIRLSDE